jgi:hypothetical protein
MTQQVKCKRSDDARLEYPTPGHRIAHPPVASEATRNRVRRQVARHAPILEHLAAMIANALTGPDPEAALVYLFELRELSDELAFKAWKLLEEGLEKGARS